MLDIYKELKNIIKKFNANNIEYALCGGIAVMIHGFVRATEDIDLLLKEKDLQKAENSLRELGFKIKAAPMVLSGRKIHRISKFKGRNHLTCDLLVVDNDIQEIWKNRFEITWDNTKIYILTKNDLIKMKEKAGRSKDLIDIAELKKLGEE